MILEANNLTKSFGLRKAVNNLSLQIPDGSVYGFLGPNGSGKSTTIRIMTALISPDAGEVFINGKSIQKNGNKALSDVGALIERADFHKHLSAKTNLKMLARMDGTDFSNIQKVLDRTGLGDRANDKVKTYSQGMKQRLGIAQALMGNPKLLILDEPTNGLDPEGMKEIRDLVGELSSEGITVFISSHLLDEVQKICSHIAMINSGKLITAGKIEDLLKNSEMLMTEIHVDQTGKSINLLSEYKWIHRCDVREGVLRVSIVPNKISELVNILVQNKILVSAIIPKTSLEDIYLSKIGIKNKV